jgi:hypothetical protein
MVPLHILGIYQDIIGKDKDFERAVGLPNHHQVRNECPRC